jgi:hypothetical protein
LRYLDEEDAQHSAYDNLTSRTQDAAILFDALEFRAARRTKFALRIALQMAVFSSASDGDRNFQRD